MTKESAINYLRFLHELEQSYSSNLLTMDLRQIVEDIRLEFLRSYLKK